MTSDPKNDDSTGASATTQATPTGNPVTQYLMTLGVEEDKATQISEKLVDNVGELEHLTAGDFTSILKPGAARALVAKLQEKKTAASAAAAPTAVGGNSVAFALLPEVPDDTAWLASLRTEGVLKVGQSTVISTIRAALAYKFGLYGITDKLVKEMERYAEETDEQVGKEFFELRKALTKRTYGDLFDALDGMDGHYVTQERKNKLLGRINDTLMPSVGSFHEQLNTWYTTWVQGASNPGFFMQHMMMAQGGGALPPGMMAPPDAGVLRDAADKVADDLNKVFRGTGVQIAAALAYEAKQIIQSLSQPGLPAMVGVTSRELMLKKLGVNVPATYPRMETNLTRYVLAILEAKNQAGGTQESMYFGNMHLLGSQIQWSEIGGFGSSSPTGLGRARL